MKKRSKNDICQLLFLLKFGKIILSNLGRKKHMKKIVIFFTTMMLSCIMLIGLNVDMAEASSISSAENYTIGNTQNGTLTEKSGEKKYYKFTLNESGCIDIKGKAYMRDVKLYIYDANADELWSERYEWNSTSEVITLGEKVYLASGTYYLCFSKCCEYGNYNFNIGFTSSNESFKETSGGSNNSLAAASVVNTDGTKYNAQIAVNDEKDFWKFTLNKSGCVKYDATFYNIKSVDIKLYDKDGNEIDSSSEWWNDTTNEITFSKDLNLTAGTYYISVSRYNGNGRYDFSFSFAPANETYPETNGGTNNTLAQASPMTLGNVYTGQIAINDEKDFYKFELSHAQPVIIKLDSPMERVYVHIYSANGEEIRSDGLYSDSVTQKIAYNKIIKLTSGTYYVAVEKKDDREGNYTVQAAEVTQDNCPHDDYDTKWHESTYFERGYRVYKCEICGYTYKGDYADKLTLGQGYIYLYSSSVGKGCIKPVWSSVWNASGYQIRYCKKSSMKGATVKTVKAPEKNTLTIKKLSRKKKYYVQVRAYIKSGNKTAYGKWSEKRWFKTY